MAGINYSRVKLRIILPGSFIVVVRAVDVVVVVVITGVRDVYIVVVVVNIVVGADEIDTVVLAGVVWVVVGMLMVVEDPESMSNYVYKK